ncbi:MAG TPA: hypothetical protein VFJ77_10390 [Gaiellaceae bacterium]|nr:hypothetical protein [Gaiellaceae bacterium]
MTEDEGRRDPTEARDDADEPLARGALDEILRPRPPFDVTALLAVAHDDSEVLPGVPLS